jgi:hypothetical protein
VSFTANLDPKGNVHNLATMVETNTSKPVYSERITGSHEVFLRITDESGQPMTFSKKGTIEDGFRYSIIFNQPMPPGGGISYNIDGQVAAKLLQAAGALKSNGAGEYQFAVTNNLGSASTARQIQVWRLPANATLLESIPGITATTNANGIELRIERLVPPDGAFACNFRYKLGEAAN